MEIEIKNYIPPKKHKTACIRRDIIKQIKDIINKVEISYNEDFDINEYDFTIIVKNN